MQGSLKLEKAILEMQAEILFVLAYSLIVVVQDINKALEHNCFNLRNPLQTKQQKVLVFVSL